MLSPGTTGGLTKVSPGRQGQTHLGLGPWWHLTLRPQAHKGPAPMPLHTPPPPPWSPSRLWMGVKQGLVVHQGNLYCLCPPRDRESPGEPPKQLLRATPDGTPVGVYSPWEPPETTRLLTTPCDTRKRTWMCSWGTCCQCTLTTAVWGPSQSMVLHSSMDMMDTGISAFDCVHRTLLKDSPSALPKWAHKGNTNPPHKHSQNTPSRVAHTDSPES